MQCASSTTSSPVVAARRGQHLVAEPGVGEPFGGDEQHVDGAGGDPRRHVVPLGDVGRVDGLGVDARPTRGVHLVAHQRQQRRDDHRGARALLAQQGGRDEVHRGLAPPGALDHERTRRPTTSASIARHWSARSSASWRPTRARSTSSARARRAGSTGVGSTGVGSTGVGSTGVGSAGAASAGAASTGAGSAGVASTGAGSTGVASAASRGAGAGTRGCVVIAGSLPCGSDVDIGPFPGGRDPPSTDLRRRRAMSDPDRTLVRGGDPVATQGATGAREAVPARDVPRARREESASRGDVPPPRDLVERVARLRAEVTALVALDPAVDGGRARPCTPS